MLGRSATEKKMRHWYLSLFMGGFWSAG